MAVCNCHDFGPFATFGLADAEIPFFADTNVPSMKHSDGERRIGPTAENDGGRSDKAGTPWRTPILAIRGPIYEMGSRRLPLIAADDGLAPEDAVVLTDREGGARGQGQRDRAAQ